MPNVSSLGITFAPSISGSVGKTQSGSDYKGPSQSANISRSFAFTNANANNTSLGADEFISYILTISAGAAAVVSLSSLTDFLLQTGVSLARIKALRLNLLSTAQDATFGTACSGVTIGGTVPAPVQAALSSSSTGGSIGAGTYNYVITALTAAGETLVSNEKVTSALTGSTSSVTLNWAAVPNATGYKIYRSTTPGTYTTPALITTIGSGSTITYTDTAASASTGAPPTVSTASPVNQNVLDGSTPTSGSILLNGDYREYATTSNSGLVVGSNTNLYAYNNDATHAAALQITTVGGTT